jgi:ribosome-associated protein
MTGKRPDEEGSGDGLVVSSRVTIPFAEIELIPMRSSGPGGQNVNKVETAMHLRFAIRASSLPEFYKQRLLALRDRRLTRDGVIVIKAQSLRSQEGNRVDALDRLAELIRGVAVIQKKRIPTRPTRAAKRRRLDAKGRRKKTKTLRGRVDPD